MPSVAAFPDCGEKVKVLSVIKFMLSSFVKCQAFLSLFRGEQG